MRAPLLFQLYATVTTLLVPTVAWIVTRKLRRAGVSVLRAHETLGHASEPRLGSGPLIWFHASSVGESLSVLALIKRMGDVLPRAHFLITTVTPTSARLVADRMPPRCTHQFAPIDARGPLRRFLKHWRPSAAIFVESEIWPLMLRMTKAQGAQMALVNARFSAKSQARWTGSPKNSRYVLGVFDLILSQNDEMAQAMVDMHAPVERVARGTNLKSMSAPLRQDPALLAQVRTGLKGRPVWVAASTHTGEDQIVLDAHKTLLETDPDLLLILVPRHPERGADVAGLIAKSGLTVAIRSKAVMPTNQQVFLADTLGELGSWYALTDVVFLGGSLRPIGGHNPFEVAQANAAVLSGPNVTNFAETFDEMKALGAARTVTDAPTLASAVATLKDNPAQNAQAIQAAQDFVRGKSDQLGSIAIRLIRALKLEEDTR